MVIKAHLDPTVVDETKRTVPRLALRLETSGFAPETGPDGDEANVTIHNISTAGLLIETDLSLSEGDQLVLDLPEAGAVGAVIVWRSEQLYGCAFETELGPAALAAVQLQGLAPGLIERLPSPSFRRLDSNDKLGSRLNRLRRAAGLTLADVATALGVSKPTVWAWEKGKARPLPERLDAIAAALGVPSEELTQLAAMQGSASEVIEDCRVRIAEAYGISTQAVRIMLEV